MINSAEIFTFQQFTVIFKVINHLQIFLIHDEEENSVLMESVIDCLYDVMKMLTNDPYEGKNIFTHLEDLILAVDEIIDEGLIVTIDPKLVFERVKMKDGSETNSPTKSGGNQHNSGTSGGNNSGGGAFSSLFGFAKNSLQKTLNMG